MAEDCILKQAILKLFVTLNGEFYFRFLLFHTIYRHILLSHTIYRKFIKAALDPCYHYVCIYARPATTEVDGKRNIHEIYF